MDIDKVKRGRFFERKHSAGQKIRPVPCLYPSFYSYHNECDKNQNEEILL